MDLLHTVDNYINWNANPLHMNTRSFGNNCNQYIYTHMSLLSSLLELSVSLLESQFIREALVTSPEVTMSFTVGAIVCS